MSGLMAWLGFAAHDSQLMENRASWVKIPASMAGIPMAVCSSPVMAPAIIPAMKAHSSATQTLTPLVISMIHTAPPVHMVPSTVKSARSKTLKVI